MIEIKCACGVKDCKNRIFIDEDNGYLRVYHNKIENGTYELLFHCDCKMVHDLIHALKKLYMNMV